MEFRGCQLFCLFISAVHANSTGGSRKRFYALLDRASHTVYRKGPTHFERQIVLREFA